MGYRTLEQANSLLARYPYLLPTSLTLDQKINARQSELEIRAYWEATKEFRKIVEDKFFTPSPLMQWLKKKGVYGE